MKKKFVLIIFIVLTGLLLSDVIYAQDRVLIKYDDVEIKNGFDYKILIKNPSAVSPFLLEYVTEDGKNKHYPYPFSLSDTARVFWLKPDSTLVVNYNWGAHLMATTKQIVLKGYFLYSIIDDNDNSRAIHEYVFEEKRFDY